MLSLKKVRGFVSRFSFVEVMVTLAVILLIAIGFFALQYFKSKVDYVMELQTQVVGQKTEGIAAESLFSEGGALTDDPIINCPFKHVPTQSARQSECAKVVECEISAGNWDLTRTKQDCLNAQASAQKMQAAPIAPPGPTPEASPTLEPTSTPEPTPTPEG